MTPTTPEHYSLVDRRWLPVLRLDGRAEEVSLRQLFAEAPTIRCLACETAALDAVVLRLLVAIALRATFEEDRKLRAAEAEWLRWWRDWDSLTPRLDTYLDQQQGRFDLLDPTEPFMQVATLDTPSGNRSGLPKLVPNISGLFTMRRRAAQDGLSLAEAARLLLFSHAYDPSGIKSGATDDKRAKGGKGYPSGYPAWAGNLGLVLLEGANLAETILLNTALDRNGDKDSAVWERPAQTGAEDRKHPLPIGPADLLTWQSRRIRLFTDETGERVTDVIIANGDFITPRGMHAYEPMAAWKVSENQTKKAGSTVWWPVTFDPARAIWRGIEPLLSRKDGGVHTLDWLARVWPSGGAGGVPLVNVRTVGQVYGPQNSTIIATVDDRLTLRVEVIAEVDLAQAAAAAVVSARQGVGALTGLAARLAQATGLPESVARDKAGPRAYDALDGPYRAWLGTLHDADGERERQVHSVEWHQVMRRTLTRLGEELCREAGRSAVIGRVLEERHVDTALAWQEFVWRLRTITLLADESSGPPGHDGPDQDQGPARDDNEGGTSDE